MHRYRFLFKPKNNIGQNQRHLTQLFLTQKNVHFVFVFDFFSDEINF